jgi:hypothetical protein
LADTATLENFLINKANEFKFNQAWMHATNKSTNCNQAISGSSTTIMIGGLLSRIPSILT